MTQPEHRFSPALQGLYQAFARLGQGWPVACQAGCQACCSDRLLLTTLEGSLMLTRLAELGRQDLAETVAGQALAASAAGRVQVSMNTLAQLCLTGQEPPAGERWPEQAAACPLLEGGLCLVYEARPLACRGMFSQQPCQAGGEAVQDPWWVTLTTAFFQLVEHLDAGGGFGSLAQVFKACREGGLEGLLPCQPLPGIPAPAEHQARLNQALAQTMSLPAQGRSLGWWLAQARP